MKRITVIAFLTLASTLGIGSASAQMQPREVHATVPFDFTVANKQLPAGTYSIARAKDGTIQILSRKGIPVAMTLASENGSPSKGCAVNFDRRDGQYFMRAVQCELRCDQHQSSCFQSREENSSGSGKSARQRRPGPDRSQVGFAKRKPRKTIKARTFPPPGLYCCSLNT